MSQSPDPQIELNYATEEPRWNLRAIALRQRMVVYSILGSILVIVLNFVATPPNIAMVDVVGGHVEVRRILGVSNITIAISLTLVLFMLSVYLFAIISAFRLSVVVYGTGVGIILGIIVGTFTVFPIIGLILPLIMHRKATKILRKNGIKVGLLGADLSQIPRA